MRRSFDETPKIPPTCDINVRGSHGQFHDVMRQVKPYANLEKAVDDEVGGSGNPAVIKGSCYCYCGKLPVSTEYQVQ